MKKLLILMLVLGMASMANAAIVPTVDGVQVAYGDDVVAGMLGLDTTDAILGYDIEITAGGDVAMDYTLISFPLPFELPPMIPISMPTAVRISSGQIFGPSLGPGSIVIDIAFTGTTGSLTFFDHLNGVALGSINVVSGPPCWNNPCQPYGDSNGDGLITAIDIQCLVAAWAVYNECCDFNHDGVITAIDIQILIAQWGNPCP